MTGLVWGHLPRHDSSAHTGTGRVPACLPSYSFPYCRQVLTAGCPPSDVNAVSCVLPCAKWAALRLPVFCARHGPDIAWGFQRARFGGGAAQAERHVEQQCCSARLPGPAPHPDGGIKKQIFATPNLHTRQAARTVKPGEARG